MGDFGISLKLKSQSKDEQGQPYYYKPKGHSKSFALKYIYENTMLTKQELYKNDRHAIYITFSLIYKSMVDGNKQNISELMQNMLIDLDTNNYRKFPTLNDIVIKYSSIDPGEEYFELDLLESQDSDFIQLENPLNLRQQFFKQLKRKIDWNYDKDKEAIIDNDKEWRVVLIKLLQNCDDGIDKQIKFQIRKRCKYSFKSNEIKDYVKSQTFDKNQQLFFDDEDLRLYLQYLKFTNPSNKIIIALQTHFKNRLMEDCLIESYLVVAKHWNKLQNVKSFQRNINP
ncbi:UNKNOWN [Stylonychia lemnae]|uniref:Uncharacterized protein n=1 Tax=Stylonychia lemnae TaxID=5949 RepID=A0A078AY05_STYLE|nr:UNKNOWN [Stylonychia lemnae]|eukprot:CDW86991.1 UNKNOWN [Stylonychia lemnae]